MTRVAIHGAAGRMGRELIRAIYEADQLELGAVLEREGHEAVGEDAYRLVGLPAGGPSLSSDLTAGLADVDVVIDFSLPDASVELLRAATACQLAAVIGTTGGREDWQSAVSALSEQAPVVIAPNFSQGVSVLADIARLAVRMLGDAFDAEIVEMHHHAKVDAPSGTAAHLAQVVTAAKGLDDSAIVHGRSGQVGARRKGEVGVLSLRGGDVVGDHTLILAGPAERLELTHRAHHRDVFARGALRATSWVVEQSPGTYDMADVMRGA